MADAQRTPATTYRRASQLVGLFFGAAFGLAISWMMDDRATSAAPLNPAAPPAALRLVVLVALVALLHSVGALLRRFDSAQVGKSTHQGRPKLRRPAATVGRSLLLWQAMFMVVLFVVCTRAQWTYESVGFASSWSVAASLAAGVALYLLFVSALTAALHVAGKLPAAEDNNLRVLAGLWPRNHRQKLALVAGMCVLNPLTEELMFRGILVHQFALAINALALPLATGLVVNLTNHAYQGAWAATTHLPFYLIAVALLFSPAGLWGAVGFHLAGDVVPILTLGNSLRRYRQRHRGREDRRPSL